MQKKIYIPITLTVMFILLGIAIVSQTAPANTESGINRQSVLCVYKNDNLVDCEHNVLLVEGKNFSRDLFAYGGNYFRNISLCNASNDCASPSANGFKYSPITGCGLSGVEGTYAQLPQNGNWSVYYKFTATCDISTNVTILTNKTGANLSAVYFTLVSLTNGDTLTLNWTNWVE